MKNNKNNGPAVNLNLKVRGLPLSATLKINEESKRILQTGGKVYKLGLGQSPFPVPDLVVEELRKNAFQKDYLPVKGLAELRESVASYHGRMDGIEATAEDVLVGPGSKELMFILQLVYYGDLVIPNPSWVSYAPQATIIGRKICWIPTHEQDRWLLCSEEIDKLCREDAERPRILILNYPNNPSGATYCLDELKAIARVARKYRIILLSDEIYGELHHKGEHVSIAKYYPEGTIISSGLSKWCGAGGWRLGTFTFPGSLRWLQEGMASVASETYTATSAPIQYAAVSAFQEEPALQQYLVYCRKVLRALGRSLCEKLSSAGVSVHEPEGAFYLFPNFKPMADQLHRRGITTGAEFCTKLLQDTGVAILPGYVFGRPEEEFTARLAYVDFNGAAVLDAVAALPDGRELDADFLRQTCDRVMTAVDLICDWIKE